MQNNYSVTIAKNFKLALAALMIALVGVQTFTLGSTRSFAAPQAKPAQSGELPMTTQAKRSLARLDAAKIARIKDPRKRDAAQKGYDAIKAVANNTSRERQPALVAELQRASQTLKSLPVPKTASLAACDDSYSRCMELCKEGGFCDCAGLNYMCYIMTLTIELVQEGDPSK